jgi:putative copper resistance protein D
MEQSIGVAQALVLIGQAILVGSCGMRQLLPADAPQATARQVIGLAQWAGLTTLPLLILLYVLRADAMLDLPLSAICSVNGLLVLGTRVGQMLQLAFALTALAAMLCWRSLAWPAALAGLSAIATAIATSHVAAQSADLGALVAMTLHVLLATSWFGGLPALVLLAWSDRETFWKILRRFSPIALPAMAVILASGAWIAAVNVGSWPALFATPYGLILLGKLACIVVTLAAALGLRRTLAALVARGAAVVAAKLLIAGEAVAATLVMLAAGILAQQVPGIHQAILWPFSFRVAPIIALQTSPEKLWTVVAALFAALALLGAGWLVWRSGRSTLAAMMTLAACGELGAWGIPAVSVPAYSTTYVRPSVPYTAHVIAEGSSIYANQCAACHGRDGRGNGPAASGMMPPPADLTQAHTTFHTMGDMYWWVSHGFPDSAMPGFTEQLSDDERWAVVSYAMALSLGY